MKSNNTKKRIPQKVALNPGELEELREYVKTFLTKQGCCEKLKMRRTITLDLLLLRGYASPQTVKNVRRALRQKQAA
jgi:hypothetical protein